MYELVKLRAQVMKCCLWCDLFFVKMYLQKINIKE